MQLDDQPGLLETSDAIVAAQPVHRPTVDANDLVAGGQRSPRRLSAGRRTAISARLDEQPVASVHAVEPQPKAQTLAGQAVDKYFFSGGVGRTVHDGVFANGQYGDERIFGRLNAAAATAVHRYDSHKVFGGHCTHRGGVLSSSVKKNIVYLINGIGVPYMCLVIVYYSETSLND